MKTSLALAVTAAFALAGTSQLVQAAPAVEATVLEAVVVTPTARYTASQWQAELAARNPVVLDRVIVTPAARYTVAEWQARQPGAQALATVVLEPVIVTPTARYTVAQWQQRQAHLAYVRQDAAARGTQSWLKTVWKHFRFARSLIEA